MTPLVPLDKLIPQRVASTCKQIRARLWEAQTPVPVAGGALHRKPVPHDQGSREPMEAVHPGECFGPKEGEYRWQQRWFRVDIPAPKAAEKGRRFLLWRCRGEHTAYLDGTPWFGFDVGHEHALLPDRECTLWIDCRTHQTCIASVPGARDVDEHGLRFDGAWTALRNLEAWEVYWDVQVLADLMHHLLQADGLTQPSFHKLDHDKADPLLRFLLARLNEACGVYAAGDLPALKDRLRATYKALPATPWALDAILVGHSHLDLAWLWPESVGVAKGIHTAASMLRYLEQYPEFTFMWTQPALYKAMERQAPELMDQIGKATRDQRWEPTGGMWVEADNNLCCGEALARCLVLGQEYFRDFQGRPSTTVWLPDVFGYSACLPQLMKQAGLDYFYTSKLGWCPVNRWPYDSFRWRGHDGSEVLAHLAVSFLMWDWSAKELSEAGRAFRQSGVHRECLIHNGLGDGGGGVLEASIERARRLADLGPLPKAKWGRVEPFFERMEAVRDKLPVHQGELYLEYHRGVFTTQGELKRLYRRAETALQTLEAAHACRGRGPVDRERWERVVFTLFHDIIPGSSIREVYDEMKPELAAIGDACLADTAKILAGQERTHQAFNPVALPRTVVAELPAALATTDAVRVNGTVVPIQRSGRDKSAVAIAALPLPPVGGASLESTDAPAEAPLIAASARHLDNGIVQAGFNAKGALSRLTVDGASLALDAPAVFRLYRDLPHAFDAWEIDRDVFSLGETTAAKVSLAVAEAGAVRARLTGTCPIGEKSTLAVHYILEAGSPWLRIECDIDWHEEHRLLKYHLPTGYRGREARFGAPFGSVLRPQLATGMAAEAMWEVPASRWAAVVDDCGPDGLAVVTEAKYGVSIREGDLGLSLLRSPKDPDPEADMGTHRIRFAVGAFREASTAQRPNPAAAGDTLFAPLVLTTGKAMPSLCTLESPGTLVPAWVLPGRDGGWILRLHETMGGRGKAKVAFAEPPASVHRVDLLERSIATVKVDRRGAVDVPYGPYEVISLLVK